MIAAVGPEYAHSIESNSTTMKKRKITLEINVFATEYETQKIRDIALDSAWEKAHSYQGVTIAAFTRTESLDNGNVESKEMSQIPTVEDALCDPQAFDLTLGYLGWTLTYACGGSSLLVSDKDGMRIMDAMNAQRACRK